MMASYLHKRIAKLRAAKGAAWWVECLKVEFGGMNEASNPAYSCSILYLNSFVVDLSIRTGRVLSFCNHG